MFKHFVGEKTIFISWGRLDSCNKYSCHDHILARNDHYKWLENIAYNSTIVKINLI